MDCGRWVEVVVVSMPGAAHEIPILTCIDLASAFQISLSYHPQKPLQAVRQAMVIVDHKLEMSYSGREGMGSLGSPDV